MHLTEHEVTGDKVALRALKDAQALAPQLVAAAQGQYDAWDEADDDTFAGGGICHLIADGLVSVLAAAAVEACAVSSMHEQHVYVVCQLQDGVYMLDIPYSLYEVGAGYSWQKLPDVKFTSDFLVWTRLDANPDAYEQYVD